MSKAARWAVLSVLDIGGGDEVIVPDFTMGEDKLDILDILINDVFCD